MTEPTTYRSVHLAEADANARATELITLAEGLFGSMTSPWKYCGVIFRDHPPHLYYFPESTTVQISLSFRAINDDLQRDFQLAHEVCHLLYPSVEPERPEYSQTNVLNEGISTYFSLVVVSAFHGKEAQHGAVESLATHSPSYYLAYQLVSHLLSMDEDAIKKIREIQPMVNEVTDSDLRESGLPLTEQNIDQLVAIF